MRNLFLTLTEDCTPIICQKNMQNNWTLGSKIAFVSCDYENLYFNKMVLRI